MKNKNYFGGNKLKKEDKKRKLYGWSISSYDFTYSN